MNADAKSNFTFSIDTETKLQFDLLCKQLGIPKSTAIIGMIKQAIRDQRLSFSLYDENGFTTAEAQYIRNRINEIESGLFSMHDLIDE